LRKRDLIRDFCRRRNLGTRALTLLDLGCGQGELLKLLQSDFAAVAGCDPSAEMLEAGGVAAAGITTAVQVSPVAIPFEDARFDMITAVCVFHHVAPEHRGSLNAEIRRVLKPGGVFILIEHNPYNPVTRLIVSRTPVDADAQLLTPGAARGMLRNAGFDTLDRQFFLFFPALIYAHCAGLERLMSRLPLGGQYAFFSARA